MMNKFDKTIIRIEKKEDHRKVEELTREAFWNVYRPGCMEHFVLKCFRESERYIPELSLVLEKEGEIIGHVMYAKSEIIKADGESLPIMTFGPISIAPEYKRRGYGKFILDESMRRAKLLGAGALAIVGNIDFYGKSGFVLGTEKGIRYADADPADDVIPYFLVKELKEGFLDGISGSYSDPKEYFVATDYPEEFAEYEASFPYKEKLKLPGQLDFD